MTHDGFDPEIVDAGGGSPLAGPEHPPDMAPPVASPLAADDTAVSEGIGAAPAGGAGTAPVKLRRSRRGGWSVGRKIAVVAAAVLVVAVGVPAAWLLREVGGGTLQADRGADEPAAAVAEYFGAGPLGGSGAADIRFGHVLCAERRETLRAQASSIGAAVQRAAANHNAGYLHAETSGDQITVDGREASVTTLVSLVFTTSQPGAPFLVGAPHAWTFRLVEDDGWRVCGVDAPVICGVVVNCEPPPPGTDVPTPSPPRGPLPIARGAR